MIDTEALSPFFGVIENVTDPEKLDRVQVRCFGYHTNNKQFIATDLLVWFFCTSSNQSSISGLGSNHSYVQGDTVFGFFIDKELQSGVIISSIKGIITEQTLSTMGFSDPESIYPLYVNESDVNRMARNENISKTIVGWKLNNTVKNIPSAKSGTWSEPQSDYDAKYPNNKVFETRSGHVVEYDDTQGHERISINHRTGSFVEFHPDGSKVDKTLGDSFEIDLSNKFIFINGNVNQVVTGNVQQNIMGEYYIKANKVIIDSDLDVLGVSKSTDHISSGVSGADHKHSQDVDSKGDIQQDTDEPLNKSSGFSKTSSDSFSAQLDMFDPEIRKS